MTVPAIEPVKNHYGNGSNTQFDFDFYIENENQLAVYKTNASNVEIKLVNGVDYSINEVGNNEGSFIIFPLQTSSHKVLQDVEVLSIQLDLPIKQETEYDVSDKLNLSAVEFSFDYVTRILQMLSRRIDRAVKVKEGSDLTADELINSIYSAQENTKMNADSAKNTAQEAYILLSNTNDTIIEIQNILARIQEENDGQSTFISTHNLFAVEEVDKKLSGNELIGYGEQNHEYSYSQYPDAYLELSNDFQTGENQIFSSNELSTSVKNYTGSTSGNFYMSYDSDLAIDTNVYSDIGLNTLIGKITNVQSVVSSSYIGSNNNFYIPASDDISEGVEAFSDSALTNSLGVVNDLKKAVGRKYSALNSGTFYSQNVELIKGLRIYQDEALTKDRGTITKIDKAYADKYTMTDIGFVFVPQNSVIEVGSKLYSDILCTDVVGEVTKKGSIAESSCYSYCTEWQTGYSGFVKHYYYTKRPLDDTYQWAYSNPSCTKKYVWNCPSGTNSAFDGKEIMVKTTGSATLFSPDEYVYNPLTLYGRNTKLLSTSALTSNNYICIDNSDVQIEYSKLGTESIDVISINTEPNETYELVEIYEKSFIKIGDTDYQSYIFDALIQDKLIAIDNGELQSVIDNGIVSTEGISFEYVLAEDGHKIVDIKYKNAVQSYIASKGKSPFYIIDTNNKKFILPVKDSDKFIYFCLGNTRIKSASIDLLNIIYDKLNKIDISLAEILGE